MQNRADRIVARQHSWAGKGIENQRLLTFPGLHVLGGGRGRVAPRASGSCASRQLRKPTGESRQEFLFVKVSGHGDHDVAADGELLPKRAQVGGLECFHPLGIAMRVEGERMGAEKLLAGEAVACADHVVLVLLQVGELGVALDLKGADGKGGGEHGVAQQLDGKRSVAGQHLDRETDGVVARKRGKAAAHRLDGGGDLGSVAFSGILGEHGGEQSRRAALARGLVQGPALADEVDVQIGLALIASHEETHAVGQGAKLPVRGGSELRGSGDLGRARLGPGIQGNDVLAAGAQVLAQHAAQVGGFGGGHAGEPGPAEIQVARHHLGRPEARRAPGDGLAGTDLPDDELTDGALELGGGEAARGQSREFASHGALGGVTFSGVGGEEDRKQARIAGRPVVDIDGVNHSLFLA